MVSGGVAGPFGEVGSGDEEADFAFGGVGEVVGGEGAGGAAAVFFEFFGEFAGDADEAVWGDAVEEGEGGVEAVGGFEEDAGFVGVEGGGEDALALAAFDGEEAAEVEGVGGEAAADEGGEDGAGAGEDFDGDGGGVAGGDEALTWVGDAGHAGVGDVGDAFAEGEFAEELGAAHGFVVLVEADEGFADVEVGEEGAGVAGVFAGDEVDGGEGIAGADGDVAEVADGGGDDVEVAWLGRHGGRGGRGGGGKQGGWGGGDYY